MRITMTDGLTLELLTAAATCCVPVSKGGTVADPDHPQQRSCGSGAPIPLGGKIESANGDFPASSPGRIVSSSHFRRALKEPA